LVSHRAKCLCYLSAGCCAVRGPVRPVHKRPDDSHGAAFALSAYIIIYERIVYPPARTRVFFPHTHTMPTYTRTRHTCANYNITILCMRARPVGTHTHTLYLPIMYARRTVGASEFTPFEPTTPYNRVVDLVFWRAFVNIYIIL
jgi:hypothetical protein